MDHDIQSTGIETTYADEENCIEQPPAVTGKCVNYLVSVSAVLCCSCFLFFCYNIGMGIL